VVFFQTLLVMVVIVLLLILFAWGTVMIPPHQRAFMYRNGVFTGSVGPGFRWVIPFVTEVQMLDMQARGLVTTSVDTLLPGGRVKIGNTEWNARSSRKRIPQGKTVKISGIDEEHVIVEEVI
jgi:membrane-bound ClpP family serine protease